MLNNSITKWGSALILIWSFWYASTPNSEQYLVEDNPDETCAETNCATETALSKLKQCFEKIHHGYTPDKNEKYYKIIARVVEENGNEYAYRLDNGNVSQKLNDAQSFTPTGKLTDQQEQTMTGFQACLVSQQNLEQS